MRAFMSSIPCQAYRYLYSFLQRGHPSVHVAVLLHDAVNIDVAVEGLHDVFDLFDDVQLYVTACQRAFFQPRS